MGMAKTDKKKKTLVLLDAHAIIHRAYHALPDFTSSTGEPTGALYGLSAMLMKLVGDLKPDYIVACYDLPEPTFRHEVYDAYKEGRAKTDDALAKQLERSRDLFHAFAIPIYDAKGFEADDILGTIVEKMKDDKDTVIVIASGDMDTLQLVDGKRVQVYTLRKGISDTIMYDKKAVEERFGFPPILLPDFKGLRGDPSDNIIGVKGVGEKTATALIKAFGTVESLYKKLKKDRNAFEKAGIKERIVKLLEEQEEEALFSKMLALIRRDAPIKFALPKKLWRDTLDLDSVFELFAEFGFRTLSERARKLFGAEGKKEGGMKEGKEAKETKEDIDGKAITETGVALWLLNSEITSPTLEDILQFARKDKSSGKDFEHARKFIFNELKEQKLESVYTDIEEPLIAVVEEMSSHGITIDTDYLKKLSKEYHKKLEKLKVHIWRLAGEEFNINSPRQLSEILFEKMGLSLKNQKRTGTGQKSTRESELEKLRDGNPIIADILAYREFQKLLSTYIDNLPAMANGSGRLHATFVQTGTTTGRMSSQQPNLQNIPIRSSLGRAIRNAFVATRGFTLIALDYSQIELRVAAFLSGDEKLIDIFKRGGDVHRAVAAEMFNVPPEQVDTEMRRRAKVINFGILYGMGVNALRQNLETTRAEAQDFLSEYFKKFSGLAQYLREVKLETERRGYTETYFGRRRYFEGIRSTLPYVKAQAERMAINAPIQGTEADIIKIAMVRIDAYLKKKGLEKDAHLLLQVHDELVYEVEKTKANEIAVELKRIMESVLTLEETHNVPIVVDVSLGKNWGELAELKL